MPQLKALKLLKWWNYRYVENLLQNNYTAYHEKRQLVQTKGSEKQFRAQYNLPHLFYAYSLDGVAIISQLFRPRDLNFDPI